MKKLYYYILGIIVIIIFSIIILIYLELNGYLNGIKMDAHKMYISDKRYMFNLSFNGRIYNKDICKDCEENGKYSIIISLKSINPLPIYWQTQYAPYYYFINDSLIKLGVNSNVFYKFKIGDIVTKKAENYYLNVEGKSYQILSKHENEWLP